jgi:hypothetical protein
MMRYAIMWQTNHVPMFGGCAISHVYSTCKGSALDPHAKPAQVPAPATTGAEMPFQKIGEEALDAKIAVRLTVEEKQRLAEDAEIAGMSVSALVRARYFGKPIIASADLAMINNLNSLRGQLKNLHNESNGEYSAETSAMLALVADAVRVIARSKT